MGMTSAQKRILTNKNRLLFYIAEIDRCIHEIAVSGTSSASLSAAGSSQSYTHADIEKLEKLRARYASRVAQINMALAGGNSTGIRHVVTTRSGNVW